MELSHSPFIVTPVSVATLSSNSMSSALNSTFAALEASSTCATFVTPIIGIVPFAIAQAVAISGTVA